MKKVILIACLLFGVNLYAGNCWKIKNSDQKAYCETIQENKRPRPQGTVRDHCLREKKLLADKR